MFASLSRKFLASYPLKYNRGFNAAEQVNIDEKLFFISEEKLKIYLTHGEEAPTRLFYLHSSRIAII
jgi:hypothetical protein